MAVPKRKTGKAATRSRRSANMKLNPSFLTECPHCHTKRPAHMVCPECGYYKGKQVIEK